MNFVVPQNLDIEDTLFWGLSIRQIIYLGGALVCVHIRSMMLILDFCFPLGSLQ